MTDSTTPQTTTAVLDRIVDGEIAVLLLEDDDRVVDQLDVDVERLPEDGRHEGAVFDLVVEEREADGEGEDETSLEESALEEISYRPEETEDRREAARDRFERLSERLSDRNRE